MALFQAYLVQGTARRSVTLQDVRQNRRLPPRMGTEVGCKICILCADCLQSSVSKFSYCAQMCVCILRFSECSGFCLCRQSNCCDFGFEPVLSVLRSENEILGLYVHLLRDLGVTVGSLGTACHFRKV